MENINKRNRKDLVYGAKAHIKSILAGLNKFKTGSPSESQYIDEHFEKLKYYIDKIINYHNVTI